MKLSKAGYGTPKEIMEMETQTVLYMLEYERFSEAYERAFIELNKS